MTPPVTPRTTREELAEATPHGDVYLRRLMRAQLGLSMLALTAFGGIAGALPLVFVIAPGLVDTQVLGIPVPLALLAVPPFPLIFLIGLLYQRRADAIDEAFRDVVSERQLDQSPVPRT